MQNGATKSFPGELEKFVQMLRQRRPFALARFADGEGSILESRSGEPRGWINRTRESASWRHVPGDPAHEAFRRRLEDALQYNAPGYYIGIPCRSGFVSKYHHLFDVMWQQARVPEEQLTFSRLFQSYNHAAFMADFLPAATARGAYLVCNEKAESDTIEHILHRWNVSSVDAAIHSLSVIGEIKEYIRAHDIRGGVFLIAVGPAAAIFVRELWEFSRENTYVDIGSALDHILFRNSPCKGLTRIYLKKLAAGKTYDKPFTWG